MTMPAPGVDALIAQNNKVMEENVRLRRALAAANAELRGWYEQAEAGS